MAPEDILNYHKYRHCKFSETCRKFHSKENCEKNNDCETFKCLKRHPRSCRYFEKFRRCKFGDFVFLLGVRCQLTHFFRLGLGFAPKLS